MTSSHSSKDPLRPPVSGGQLAGAVWSVVTDSTPETGGSTPQGGGGGWFPLSVHHATEGVDGFHLSFHHAAGIFTCRSATINRGKGTLTSDWSLLTAPQVNHRLRHPHRLRHRHRHRTKKTRV